MKRLHRSLFSLLEKIDKILALGHKFDSQGETVKSPGTSFSVSYLSGFLSGCLRLFASYKGGSQQFCIKTYPRNALLVRNNCYCAMLNCDFKRLWLKKQGSLLTFCFSCNLSEGGAVSSLPVNCVARSMKSGPSR